MHVSGSTGFSGNGEVHGVLKFSGSFTSLSFDDSSENWHGYQIGVGNVPEPASWALMIVGFGMVGAAARRRRTAVTAYASVIRLRRAAGNGRPFHVRPVPSLLKSCSRVRNRSRR